MKIRQVFDFETDAGQLSEGLRHQAGLKAHLRLAHLAFDLRPGNQCGNRVYDQDIHAVGADEDLDDLERLFAVVGLRDEQVVEVDPQLSRVLRIERVLGVHEGRHAAKLLRLGNDLQRQRGLARGFGSEDLDDAAARHAADPERVVEAHRPGRNGGNRRDGVLLPEAHDRALAELFLDLADGRLDGLEAFAVVPVFCCCHNAPNVSSCRVCRHCDSGLLTAPA